MTEKKNVLIVDDSVTVRDLLLAILKGFEVIEAVSGYDALKKINGDKPDVIITDINMPDMNGVDLIKNIRHKKGYEEIPLIVLSSLSPYLAGVNQKELGIMDWIEKPFSPKHLLSIIDRVSGKPA